MKGSTVRSNFRGPFQQHHNPHLAPAHDAYLTASDAEVEVEADVSHIHLVQPAPQAALPPQFPSTLTTSDLNLTVLRRYDSSITSILSVAPYAVIYTFSPTTSSWERAGVEGALFVCSLADSPPSRADVPSVNRSAVVVLNRRGLENFTLQLTSAEDVEVTTEYVILQGKQDGSDTPVIYGLWIHAEKGTSTEHMRTVNAATIQTCAVKADEARKFAGDANSVYDTGYGLTQFAAVASQWPAQHTTSYGNSQPNMMQHLFPNLQAGPEPQRLTDDRHQGYVGGGGGGGGDVLGELFWKARHDYHSTT